MEGRLGLGSLGQVWRQVQESSLLGKESVFIMSGEFAGKEKVSQGRHHRHGHCHMMRQGRAHRRGLGSQGACWEGRVGEWGPSALLSLSALGKSPAKRLSHPVLVRLNCQSTQPQPSHPHTTMSAPPGAGPTAGKEVLATQAGRQEQAGVSSSSSLPTAPCLFKYKSGLFIHLSGQKHGRRLA